MANSATALAAIPSLFRGQQSRGLITPVVVVFDTIDSDLTLYTPVDSGNHVCVLGMIAGEASAHTLTWKSPAATTLLVQERAVNTELIHRIDRPLIVGQKGQALILRCGTAAVSSMLVYIAELSRIELLNF